MISSLLDNDFYKFTMQAAVLDRHPGTKVEYRLFSRRTPLPWESRYVSLVRTQLESLRGLRLSREEADWLRGLELLPAAYLDWLETFELNPDQIDLARNNDGQIEAKIAGVWEETILWEVPLLAILSQGYYEAVQDDWDLNLRRYADASREKARRLSEAGCPYSEFGTRRRRSRAVQEAAVRAFADFGGSFAGTSNVDLARRYGVDPVGTVAHEWIMGIAGLHGPAQANGIACREWLEVHDRLNLIALTDTYTVDLFLKDFSPDLAARYHGVRHDSGDAFAFIDRMVAFYDEAGIDPKEKVLIFSDGLNVDTAIAIRNHANGRIKSAFGIGTHFTNDFGDKPLDIVIKLTAVNDRPVAKLTSDPDKATGSPEAVEEARREVSRVLRRKV